jgi:DNA-binding NarL/FixJ family response regulator
MIGESASPKPLRRVPRLLSLKPRFMLPPLSPDASKFPRKSPGLRIAVLSPHRLVPLALGAVGKKDRSFSVVGAAQNPENALSLVADACPDVVVFDPTVVLPVRMGAWLDDAMRHLVHPRAFALLLEPAQPWTMLAVRVAWDAGVRCAMTSQDQPDFWPCALNSAARGASFASPLACELFGLLAGEVAPESFETSPVFSSSRSPGGRRIRAVA